MRNLAATVYELWHFVADRGWKRGVVTTPSDFGQICQTFIFGSFDHCRIWRFVSEVLHILDRFIVSFKCSHFLIGCRRVNMILTEVLPELVVGAIFGSGSTSNFSDANAH